MLYKYIHNTYGCILNKANVGFYVFVVTCAGIIKRSKLKKKKKMTKVYRV